MRIDLHVEGDMVRVRDSEGRIYAETPRFIAPCDEPRAGRLLDIVDAAFRAGAEEETMPTVGIVRGRSPDGREPVWRIEDGAGRIYAATSRGPLPIPGPEARRLLSMVKLSMERGRDWARDPSPEDASAPSMR